MEAEIRVMLPQVKGSMGLPELEQAQRSSQSLESQPGPAIEDSPVDHDHFSSLCLPQGPDDHDLFSLFILPATLPPTEN